jgi:hypothetical protein
MFTRHATFRSLQLATRRNRLPPAGERILRRAGVRLRQRRISHNFLQTVLSENALAAAVGWWVGSEYQIHSTHSGPPSMGRLAEQEFHHERFD